MYINFVALELGEKWQNEVCFFCQVYKGYILNYTSIWFFSWDIKTTSCLS